MSWIWNFLWKWEGYLTQTVNILLNTGNSKALLDQLWPTNFQEWKYTTRWPSPFFYVEAKFGPLEKKDKNDWHQ